MTYFLFFLNRTKYINISNKNAFTFTFMNKLRSTRKEIKDFNEFK